MFRCLESVFPDATSFGICLAYMGAFIAQGILTRASQVNGGYTYNTSTAVMTSEVLKLCISVAVYVKSYVECCSLVLVPLSTPDPLLLSCYCSCVRTPPLIW